MSLWHPARLAQILAYDDTQVSADITETEKKYARINIGGAGIGFTKLRIIISIWTNNASYPAYARIYLDNETTYRQQFESTSTTEEIKSGIIEISGLTPGIHIIRLKLLSLGGTAYNELFEIWGVV